MVRYSVYHIPIIEGLNTVRRPKYHVETYCENRTKSIRDQTIMSQCASKLESQQQKSMPRLPPWYLLRTLWQGQAGVEEEDEEETETEASDNDNDDDSDADNEPDDDDLEDDEMAVGEDAWKESPDGGCLCYVLRTGFSSSQVRFQLLVCL